MPPLNPTLPLLNPSAATALKVVSQGTLLNQTVVNTWYYIGMMQATLIDQGEMAAFAEVWVGEQANEIVTALNVEYVMRSLIITNLTYPDQASYTTTLAGGGLPGERTGECLPPQDAILFNRKTQWAGRHGRGSIRLAGVSEGDQNNGEITSAGLLTILGSLASTVFMQNIVYTASGPERTFFPALAMTTGGQDPDVFGSFLTQWDVTPIISSQNSRKIPRAGS